MHLGSARQGAVARQGRTRSSLLEASSLPQPIELARWTWRLDAAQPEAPSKLWSLDRKTFEAFEPQIYRAAAVAYARDDTVPLGEMREVTRIDPKTGQRPSYKREPLNWVTQFVQ
jgi:hypothetical protein